MASRNIDEDKGNRRANYGYDDSIRDIISKFNEFRRNGELCDFNLISADQEIIPVHRLVVGCRCDYFLEHKNKDSIEFPNTSTDVLQKVVDFLYSGGIHLYEDDVHDTYEVAKHLNLEILKEYCTLFMQDLCDETNLLSMLEHSLNVDNKEMSDFCKNKIISSFTTYKNNNSLAKLNVDSISSILISDDLPVTEDIIWDVIQTYMSHNEDLDSEDYENLFAVLRIERLSKSAMGQIVKSKSIQQNLPEVIERVTDLLISNERSYSLPRKLLPEEEEVVCSERSDLLATTGSNNSDYFLVYIPEHLDQQVVYDLQKSKWYSLQHDNLRTNLCSLSTCSYSAWFSAVCCYYGFTVICGGDINEVSQANVHIHDSRSDEWSEGSSMLRHRSNHTIIGFRGYLYAIGGIGCGNTAERLKITEDVTSERWEAIAMLNNGYSGHGTVTLDFSEGERIVCFGGLFNKSVECYNAKDDEWEQLQEMDAVRNNPMYGVSKNRLFVFSLAATKYTGEYYDVNTNQWTSIDRISVLASPGKMLSYGDCLYSIVEIKNRCCFVEYDVEQNKWALKDHKGPPFIKNGKNYTFPKLPDLS